MTVADLPPAPLLSPPRSAPLRVLLISHTCQSASEGQIEAQRLGEFPDIHLRVLTPDRWFHYGKWRETEPAISSGFEMSIGRVALPWLGPAQSYFHAYPRLRQMLEEFRPDIINLWEEPWGLVSAHACCLRNRLLPGTRIISETEQNINKSLPPPFSAFRRYTLHHADFVVARSEQALEVMRSRGYAGPARVVPNAVDADIFRPLTAAHRDAVRRARGWTGCVVGYVGRLVAEKGVLDLLDAVALCPPDVHLVLIGEGPLAARIYRRAAERSIGSRVHRLGMSAPAELAEMMGAMDLLALPSRTTRRWREQFGRVIIEANGCGVPVIGSDSGAIPQVVGAGGLIFPEGNVGALAAAIEKLRSDADAARQLGAAGRTQVQAKYTWQRVAEQMREIYRAAAAQ